MRPATPSSGARLAGIEGLRALAASSVLVYHTWNAAAPDGHRFELRPLTALFPDLSLGVVLFFALSGFLLYRPFAARIVGGEPRPDGGRYLANRARRIVPAYWVILLACALVLRTTWFRHGNGSLDIGPIDDPALLARNLLLLQNAVPASVLTGIGAAWSLAVEVVYYLALPLLAGLAWWLGRRCSTPKGRRAAALLPPGVLLVTGIAGKAVAAVLVDDGRGSAWQPDRGGVFERSFLVHADLFAFGMALAVLHVEWEPRRRSLGRRSRIAIGLVALACYAAVAGLMTEGQLTHSPYNTLMAVACTLVLALVVLPDAGGGRAPIVRVLEAGPLVALGTISYSVFLWHEPVIFWVRARGLTMSGSAGFGVNVLVVGAVTVALSILTYRFVEAPFLRRKEPMASHPARDRAPGAMPVVS